jgi:hypothetical protein
VSEKQACKLEVRNMVGVNRNNCNVQYIVI